MGAMPIPEDHRGRSPLRHLMVLAGASAWTLAFFLVLPLIQAIGQLPEADLLLRAAPSVALPPPPPAPEDEPEKEEEKEEKPPELQPDAPPLDLSQLELALNPGVGGGWTTADFAMKLDRIAGGDGSGDDPFSLADLDQQPRAIYRLNPQMTTAIRRKAPGTVQIVFVVDEQGRVQNPVVQSSPDPVFEKPALDAIRKWKFEPGKRGGKAVSTRMRVPITFPDK
jgi:protein TonB